MSNTVLIAALVFACDQFVRGETSLRDLRSAIEINGQALEGAARDVQTRFQAICNNLELIEFACTADAQRKAAIAVMEELRTLVAEVQAS